MLAPETSHALSFTVDSATVNVNDTFFINLNVDIEGADLTSWQFDVSFNPILLQANTVTEGSFLSSFGTTLFTPDVIDNTTGLISLVATLFVDLPPNPNWSGVLASIEFTALQAGTSPLTASNVFLNGLDSGFTVTSGTVCVNGASACDAGGGTVPEPSTIWLLSLGGLLV